MVRSDGQDTYRTSEEILTESMETEEGGRRRRGRNIQMDGQR